MRRPGQAQAQAGRGLDDEGAGLAGGLGKGDLWKREGASFGLRVLFRGGFFGRISRIGRIGFVLLGKRQVELLLSEGLTVEVEDGGADSLFLDLAPVAEGGATKGLDLVAVRHGEAEAEDAGAGDLGGGGYGEDGLLLADGKDLAGGHAHYRGRPG